MNSMSTTAMPADQLVSLIDRHLRGRVKVLRFRVVVQEGGLILHGCVPTYYAKQLIQHAAMEVSGLPILTDEIEVQ
jgi:osmotically-inducible protein OsmY